MFNKQVFWSAIGFSVLVFFVGVQTAAAQGYAIKGRVTDGTDKSALVGATVIAKGVQDTTIEQATVTNERGFYAIPGLAAGSYRLMFRYLGYRQEEKTVQLVDKDVFAGMTAMVQDKNVMKEVTVKEAKTRAEMNGDTVQYHADAFKTNPDATAEDLVKKMPGVVVSNSGVQVNGQSVKKVLVDGKEFFGSDPSTAMKNLPADMINKVQVFDNMSDQARFTGFSDGNTDAVMNFITKDGMSKGQFGRVYAGYGTTGHYSAGLSLNFFNDDRRISLLGMSNNINQQNFSISDVMGLMGSGGGGRGGPGRGGNQGGLDVRNLVNGASSNGNTTTNAGGINYTDQLGKKVKLTGSYFFNQTDNINDASTVRHYFTSDALVYTEKSRTETKNTNHRASMRLEYTIDKNNSIIYSPTLTVQQNKYSTKLNGDYTMGDTARISGTVNNQYSDNTAFGMTNSLLLRHKFGKRGRTLSLNLSSENNNRYGGGNYYSLTDYERQTSSKLLDQEYSIGNTTQKYGADVVYTEPVGEKGQLQLSYNPAIQKSDANKTTNDMDVATGDYTSLNTILSNKYKSSYTTQKGGATYRLNAGKTSYAIGADVQSATLQGEQTYPAIGSIERNFNNVLPNAMFTYRKDKGQSLRVMYRTATNAPGITDMQNVVDYSNPLLLSTGNPNLKQSYDHKLMLFYRNIDKESSRTFFSMMRGTYTSNYISTQTLIPTTDTTINNVAVNRGSQMVLPVNVGGYYDINSFLVYGMPVSLIKSNVNISGGVNYTRTPTLINYSSNISNNTGFSLRTFVGSNISENVDVNLSYSGTYNIVKNSLQKQSDNNYFTHTANATANFILGKRVVLNTSYTFTAYAGLSSNYNQSYQLWNGYIGYKLLKNRQLEAKVSVFDILNQNRNISRTVTQTYTSDNQSTVLRRYFMLTLTYTLKHFTKGDAPVDHRPPGMPPPQFHRH